MSKPVTPGWPESGVFPFMPFPLPGTTPGAAPPLMQGLTGSIDLMKDFWSQLPGGAPLPGFLVPTIDVEELDKRIADLKAAQSWVEINLNMLRTTIQGLEVQRNTIAAIRSFATPVEKHSTSEPSVSPGGPAAAALAASGAAANWLGYLQDQFAKVAQAATTTATPTTGPTVPKSALRKKKAKATAKVPRRPATTA